MGAEPAQEIGAPLAALVGFKPHLLPMALVFAGDADALAHRSIEAVQQLLQGVFTEGSAAAELGLNLALHHQIAVAADRRSGLGVGRQPQAEVRGRLSPHQASAEAALDRGEAHGTIGQGVQLGLGWKLSWQLTAEGQRQVVLYRKAGGDRPGQDHRFSHHRPRWARFADLQHRFAVPAADAPFRQIHQQRALADAPLTTTVEQLIQVG